jgi:hypothetical protein
VNSQIGGRNVTEANDLRVQQFIAAHIDIHVHPETSEAFARWTSENSRPDDVDQKVVPLIIVRQAAAHTMKQVVGYVPLSHIVSSRKAFTYDEV